jgi:hypothetical protein
VGIDRVILISHRGNISGPSKFENQPGYILSTLAAGYDCEVDVWLRHGKWFLGHDGPEHFVESDFLNFEGLWLHCKNIEALSELTLMSWDKRPNFFWHQNDDVALTSNGFLWTYPGKQLAGLSIAVLPERVKKWDISIATGICSDHIGDYK